MEIPSSTKQVEAKLSTLFAEHFDSVFSFCVLRCGSRSLAEEIASDVFTDAVRAVSTDPDVSLTRGWFTTVARRRVVDHWRREERERTRVDRFIRFMPREGSGSPYDGERVLVALDSLSERQRLVLTLRYCDELSVSEVAEELALSYRATESLLARARKALARSYAETEQQQ